MTREKKQKTSVLQLLEKTWIRSVLIVFSVLLIIGGPTFLIYVLQEFGVPQPLLIIIGLTSLAFGIVFFMGLAKEETRAHS